MELTVYRQASKERDGHIFYKGEDAVPYVDGNVLMVADGMGGAGAIRHTNFDKNLFDEDKLFDVLFGGCHFRENAEFLRKYVTKSFREFLVIKDCYFDKPDNMKKSGYFGSRIVSALFLNLAKNMSKQLDWESFRNPQKRQKALKQYGAVFTQNIKKGMDAVVSRSKLTYETSFKGLALLGTTLCGTIFNEEEDFVEALYFVAGDSRPYMWNEKGLHQVSKDQERSDGGMTNYVKANGDFDIICNYHRFEKPCVLFNASDGVFDSVHFKVSQLALEKLLLDTVAESESMEEVADKLTEIFKKFGTHDDSSTIALKTFGYSDFGALKEAAKKRLDVIKEEYLSQMEGLLDNDYGEYINQKQQDLNVYHRQMRNELWKKEGVVDYALRLFDDQIQLEDNDLYNQSKEYDGELDAISAKMEENKSAFAEFVRLNVKKISNDVGDTILLVSVEESEAEEIAEKILKGEQVQSYYSDSACAEGFANFKTAEASLQEQRNAVKKRYCDWRMESARKLWFSDCADSLKDNCDAIEHAKQLEALTGEEYDCLREQFPAQSDADLAEALQKRERQLALTQKYDEEYYSLINKEDQE